LTGAGGNLLAVDALDRLAGVRLDYVDWLVFGLPFALVSCFASAWVILHLFLDAPERCQRLEPPSARPALRRSRRSS
jgi:solute carrier family 13 (sodium-dependent dicarboxylate transporter), member 2/3/5